MRSQLTDGGQVPNSTAAFGRGQASGDHGMVAQGYWHAAMHIDRLGLGIFLTILPALASPCVAGPAVASRYNEIKLSQEQCLKNAEAALRKSGLETQDRTEQSRYGARGEYTGVVRCIASNGLVIFVGSGPSRQIADNLAGALYRNFECGLH
jgi:hypothetical protein